MSEKPLPRWVSEEIRVHGWNPRSGVVVERNTWVKDGVMISIYPGRTSQTWQVSYTKLSESWNRLLDTDQLHLVIEGKYRK